MLSFSDVIADDLKLINAIPYNFLPPYLEMADFSIFPRNADFIISSAEITLFSLTLSCPCLDIAFRCITLF